MGWYVTLLGTVAAVREGVVVSRFESSRTVALLARLALHPHRVHPREELCDLLWPEVEPEVARVRLRHTLRTLRAPLEAGLPAGSVLIADRVSVRLNPEALTCDVVAFERALAHGDRAEARRLYAGELLPGLWDDWIVAERNRLDARFAELPATVVPAPALTPERSAPRTLSAPPYRTALFGRDDERAAVGALLERSSLVTLTGLGGVGKTRLAAAALPEIAPRFDLTAFVGLGECVTAAQVPGRLRAVLELPPGDADPLEQICWRLAEVDALLVLDNLEQLVDSGGAALVELLLARLPRLSVLATSRRALGIEGERLLPIEPLRLTDSQALFIDRVQATRPGFHLTDGNRADIEAVCAGLEGIPLALELAAARIRAFTPAEMRRELQSRFAWLARTGLKGDKEDRHRSLAVALDWSWRLLSPSQQQFLAALSLFRAPFTADEAAAITRCADARERLEALAADSLVVDADESDDERRHALRETVREFALPRLLDADAVRARFRRRYRERPTGDANTAAAWEMALEDGAGDDAHALAVHRDIDWTARLGVDRTRALLERTGALPNDDPRARFLVVHRLAQCLLRANARTEALALIDAATDALADAPEPLWAEALSYQAHIGLYDAPRARTEALLGRCLALARDPFVRAEALRMHGCLLCWTPEYERAEPLFDEAEALYGDDPLSQARLLIHRAHLARRRGRFDVALDAYARCAERARTLGDMTLHKTCLSNRADVLTCLERWDEAIALGCECLATEAAYGDRHVLTVLVWNLARPFLEIGEPERAARLIAAAATIWEREVRPLSDDDHAELAVLRADLADRLGATALERLWADGARLSLKEAIALASNGSA